MTRFLFFGLNNWNWLEQSPSLCLDLIPCTILSAIADIYTNTDKVGFDFCALSLRTLIPISHLLARSFLKKRKKKENLQVNIKQTTLNPNTYSQRSLHVEQSLTKENVFQDILSLHFLGFLWHFKCHGLFTAKVILEEEQQCYYLTYIWVKSPRGISPTVNVIAQLEFELVYLDVVVQQASHNATGTVFAFFICLFFSWLITLF